jgi:hypothetical protein
VKGHLSLSTFLIYNDMIMFLCKLMFELYAYRFNFTGEGVRLNKKIFGGNLVWPASRPDHPAADRTGPAEPSDWYTDPCFGGPPDPPGPPPDSRRDIRRRRAYRRAVRPRGRRRRTYRRIGCCVLPQWPDFHLPINTPSPSWGRVRSSPTIVHL